MSSNVTPPSGNEATADDWEQQANRPLIADARKRKLSIYGVGALGVVAVGALLLLNSGSGAPVARPTDNIDVAEPRRLGPLAARAASAPPAAASKPQQPPADTPASQQQRGGSEDALAMQRAQMEMQRRLAEEKLLEARMKSDIMGKAEGGAMAARPASGPLPSMPGAPAASEQGPQDANSRFARAVSGSSVPVSRAGQIHGLEHKILQGKSIDAKTIQAASSDLPGMLCAQVDSDTFAEQGRLKLIPWGSRVCGKYSAEVRKGQARLFVVMNELRRPDGGRVVLDSIGGDQLGMAGLGGTVDRHFAEIFGASALIAIVGAGAANTGVGGGDQFNSAAQYRDAVQQAAAQTSTQLMQSYINIPPTVMVPPGTRMRIFVNRDLDFTELYRAEEEAAAGPQPGDVFATTE